MVVKIKTELIEIIIEDSSAISSPSYTKISTSELPRALKAIIDEAVRLHNEVKSKE